MQYSSIHIRGINILGCALLSQNNFFADYREKGREDMTIPLCWTCESKFGIYKVMLNPNHLDVALIKHNLDAAPLIFLSSEILSKNRHLAFFPQHALCLLN